MAPQYLARGFNIGKCDVVHVTQGGKIGEDVVRTLRLCEAEACLGESGGNILVIAGGRHKGGDLTEMVDAIQTFASKTLLIGEVAPLLKASLDESAEVCETMIRAVVRARELARPGDTVILAPGCASFDQFSSFEARGESFREEVRRG